MTFHGIHTVELPEKRKTKPIDVMQLVNCYFLNEKLRFSFMHFRGFSGTYNMHESTFFSRTCVCVFGGEGVSDKFIHEKREFELCTIMLR